jgi:hypothetical protein
MTLFSVVMKKMSLVNTFLVVRGVIGEKLLREEEVAEDVVGEELVMLMCVCERERWVR